MPHRRPERSPGRSATHNLKRVLVNITMKDREPYPTVAIVGEADADNCRQVGEFLDEIDLDVDTTSTLGLDLTALSFIDSSAVSEMLRLHRDYKVRGIDMVIVDASPAVHRVLEITGLLPVFGLA